MKNVDMAKDYAFRAKRCLREAELALSEHDFPGAVRRSQEALEMAVNLRNRLELQAKTGSFYLKSVLLGPPTSSFLFAEVNSRA